MKPKNHNILLTLALSIITFLSGTPLALAQAAGSNTSTSSGAGAPFGVIIAWAICNSQKRKAIGGWLLYYYMQLFGGVIISILFTVLSLETLTENLNITNWGTETMQYYLYLLSILPSYIILIMELIIGSVLLSKKFRNRTMYNLLRITLAIQFVFGLIGLFIDINYWPEDIPFDILPMITSTFWLIYFTFSKRVKLVFIENKWEPDILHPPKIHSA